MYTLQKLFSGLDSELISLSQYCSDKNARISFTGITNTPSNITQSQVSDPAVNRASSFWRLKYQLKACELFYSFLLLANYSWRPVVFVLLWQ